jgi:hypothetical protein
MKIQAEVWVKIQAEVWVQIQTQVLVKIQPEVWVKIQTQGQREGQEQVHLSVWVSMDTWVRATVPAWTPSRGQIGIHAPV